MTFKKLTLGLFIMFSVVFVSGCSVTQGTIEKRGEVLGQRPADSNFLEARQIGDVEDWKDLKGKIVNVYLINPATGNLLVPPVQCMGVPNSSTESLEPNNGRTCGSESGCLWKVPVDGADIYTTELAGKDGSFGDPVHFRYCMTADKQYFDFPAYGLPYFTSSGYYVFPPSTIKRDYATEAKLLIAEQILKRGGCINIETLEEKACPATLPAPSGK